MASTIKIKNSSTAGAVPTSSDLVQGELAINVTDRRIFTENASGTVVELGTPSIDDNGNATAITIDSSENVGIGTASPAYKLQVTTASTGAVSRWNYTGGSRGSRIELGLNETAGGVENYIDFSGSSGTSAGIFKASGSEVMRINSSGNLLVGQTSQSNGEKFGVSSASAYVGYFTQTNNASGTNTIRSVLGSNANNTASTHFTGQTGSNFWYLYGNGTTSFSSDERLKKNIETARSGYAEDLCKLRVVKYNWNTNSDGEAKELGLIAQEVEQIFPGLVQDALEESEDGNTYKVLKASVLPFMLLKAIQEQQAMITSQSELITTLTERITALEQA